MNWLSIPNVNIKSNTGKNILNAMLEYSMY